MWAEVREGQLIGPKLVQETTEKILQIKDRLKAARDRQKSYVDKKRKHLETSVDAKLNFMEEPMEILEREFKKLKRNRIAIVKVRWNSKRGKEFMWECEHQMKLKSIDHIDKSHEDPHSGHNKDIVVEDSMNHMDKNYSFHCSTVLTHNEAGTMLEIRK
nr:putative reverse transcriptase domain-containing protein [Tanacetum cinerariifolium]